MEVYNEIGQEVIELHLNDSSKEFLKETAKWTYFLSILGYIGIGFIVVMAFFTGVFFKFISNLSPEMYSAGLIGGTFISLIYIVIAGLYFFPVYYLNRFSIKVRLALKNNDSLILSDSFRYLNHIIDT
jgi:hypothetical protein